MKYKEYLIRLLVFLTDKTVIITAVIIAALIILHPTFMRTLERMRMSSIYDKMESIAASQKNYEISHARYANDFRDLNLSLKDKDGEYLKYDSARMKHFNLVLADNGVLAKQNKNEYFVYYDYTNSSFHCAPSSHYICKNISPITKDICEEADMVWSYAKSSCYMTEKDRCLDLGMPWNSKERKNFCGYKNISNKKILEGAYCFATKTSGCQGCTFFKDSTCEGKSSFGCMQSKLQGGNCVAHRDTACHSVQINKGSTCLVNDDYSGNYGCQNTTINDGGLCLAVGSNILACNKATINDGGICKGYANTSCNSATVLSGGICEANAVKVCQEITVKKGGKCVANAPQTCNGTYEDGSCCLGDYCPADSPKCVCRNYAKSC